MQAIDRATTLSDGAKLIHIGMPKTGTTALQAAWHAERATLEELGVHNVGRGRHEMKTALTAAGTLAPYWGDRWQGRWQKLADEFRTSSARCTFWSSETLTQATPERIQHIADELGSDVHVVLTLRPLAPLLASQWQEVLRRRGTDSLDAWLRRHFETVSLDGTVNRAWTRVMPELHRFSLARIVEEWGRVFGEDRLIFLVPPPRDHVSNLRNFERLMGVPEGTLELQDLDNASLPYPEAELLRHFNIAYSERGGEHATWMFTVGGPGKIGMRQLSGLEPAPIRTPRWAAELANDYSQRWLQSVEASDATVVGDLQDLLVEPADYPEGVEPPTTVNVASAGRIADVIFKSGLEHNSAQSVPVAQSSAAGALHEVPGKVLLGELRQRALRRLGRRS